LTALLQFTSPEDNLDGCREIPGISHPCA